MDELARRDARTEIAAMTYEGVDSVRDAATLREQMAATVELAKRAHLDAREYLWNAREAERALGRMILAAREAGDLASDGQRADGQRAVDTLDSLGISRDLAAHAVSLARLPDDVWQAWHDQDRDPTQAAISRAAREYEVQLERISMDAKARRNTQRRLQAERDDIERQLRELSTRVRPDVDVPPLREDETDVSAVDFVAPAAAAEEPMADRDRHRGDAWLRTLRQIEGIVSILEHRPPDLPEDHFADLTVLSARDLARRVTTSAAVWIRAVNTAYDERLGKS